MGFFLVPGLEMYVEIGVYRHVGHGMYHQDE
jgi:hypothetical protein